MKKLIIAAIFACGIAAAVEAAPEAAVTQSDLQALIQRITQLEAQNKAQAARIAELEDQDKQLSKWIKAQDYKVTEQEKKLETLPQSFNRIASQRGVLTDAGTTTNETGHILTTAKGWKYYLADKAAGIFEPLSESGLKITPYGYILFEGVYNTHGVDADVYADWVKNPNSRGYEEHTSVFSMQDSILGLQFETPEPNHGWMFTGRAEMDFAGADANDYAFHWRHLYVNAEHESGWSVLFGQTWHLWKIVSPSEIDGAWMENTGHPYRRSPQVRVTKKWDWEDSSLEVRLGVVKNGPGMGGDRDEDRVQDNSASAWPLFEGAVVYDHDSPWQEDYSNKRWLFGIGGMYGQDRIRNQYDDRKDDYDSMMIMLAGSIPFWDFTLTGQIFAGENLGGVQAGVGQTVAFDPVMGDGMGVQTVGGFIDLAYHITDDWSAAIGYGFDSPTIKSGYEQVDDDGFSSSIKHNDRAYIDVFYQITANFKLGLEYARLNTRYADATSRGADCGGNAYSDRIQFSAFYDF